MVHDRETVAKKEMQPIEGDCPSEKCKIHIMNSGPAADRSILKEISGLQQKITDLFIATFYMGGDDSYSDAFHLHDDVSSVHIAACSLSPELQINLGKQLSASSKLEILNINSLPHMAKEIVQSSVKNDHLKHLLMTNCKLDDERAARLFQNFQNFQNLVTVDFMQREHHNRTLDYPEMEDSKCGRSMTFLTQCKCLCHINFGGIPTGSGGVLSSARAIIERDAFPSLQQLKLRNCGIGSSAFTELMKALSALRFLRSLDVAHNHLTNAFRDLDQNLVHPSLMLLDIGHTHLNEEDLHNLISRINNKKMPSLSTFHAEHCNVSASTCIELLQIASKHNLDEIFLYGNPISGALQTLGPNLICPDLRHLNLSDSSLSEQDIQVLAEVVRNKGMPRLQLLELGYCKLQHLKLVDNPQINHKNFVELLCKESEGTFEAWRSLLGNSHALISLREGNICLHKKPFASILEEVHKIRTK